MRRRDFLAVVGVIAPMALWRRSLAQPSTKRAAIIIGINKSGNLPTLSAAVSGARQVAQWLRAEEFAVQEFLDETGPVTVGNIYGAVEQLIDLGTIEQLLIYFSGHGFQVGYSEYWLLSKAPRNPNESISLVESVELARRWAIPNVVFISDACRSTSESLGIQSVHGGLIFPSDDSAGRGNVNVDQFFAALPGAYALELPLQASVMQFEGIYTTAFLHAYKHPDKSMVKTVRGMSVVPNRLLKDYLVREVRKRAEAKSIRLTQHPESRVESDDTTYIGRVVTFDASNAPEAPARSATIADVAKAALMRSGLDLLRPDPGTLPSEELDRLAQSSGFATTRAAILQASSSNPAVPRQFETRTGLIVSGARMHSVATSHPEMAAQILEPGDGSSQAAVLRLAPVPGSVILRFDDGSGTVVANLPDYIGTIVVKAGGVVDVSYLPSLNSWRGSDDPQTMRRLTELRASVATAAQFGVFRLDGDRDRRSSSGAELADRIRVLKGIDPTLGLYAAYAYTDAGLIDQVRSVRTIMRGDLGTDLFDVAMLAGELSGRPLAPLQPVVPFCPMLNQGWSLLRVRGVRVPQAVEHARLYLRPALWTTFAPEGIRIIETLGGRYPRLD